MENYILFQKKLLERNRAKAKYQLLREKNIEKKQSFKKYISETQKKIDKLNQDLENTDFTPGDKK